MGSVFGILFCIFSKKLENCMNINIKKGVKLAIQFHKKQMLVMS